MALAVFLASVLALAYVFAGYPAVLYALAWARRRRPLRRSLDWVHAPSVSVIVAAHNEAANIRARIANLLSQEYPPARLQIVIGSDGSTDGTVSIASGRRDPRVLVLDLPRSGRAAVHNACAEVATGEILVFTDAGTRFSPDCLRQLVAPFADPEVGCASGKLVYTNCGASGLARSAGWYWRYELLLRRLETRLGSTVAVTGACMAMRRMLFRPLEAGDDIDDAAPLDVLLAGRRVVYVPEAVAWDHLPDSAQSELAARERIVTKNLAAVVHRPEALSLRRHPRVAFMLVSHRILRYLSPVFLAAAFASNCLLADPPLLAATWYAQLGLYGGALIGFLAERRKWQIPVLPALFAFCLANIGFLLGVWNTFVRKEITLYEPVR